MDDDELTCETAVVRRPCVASHARARARIARTQETQTQHAEVVINQGPMHVLHRHLLLLPLFMFLILACMPLFFPHTIIYILFFHPHFLTYFWGIQAHLHTYCNIIIIITSMTNLFFSCYYIIIIHQHPHSTAQAPTRA